MNIREAILRAADHIERNPGEFDFQRTYTPSAPGCGTPGCALGWIGCFLGLKSDASTVDVAVAMGITGRLVASWTFYDRMEEISRDWHITAGVCAKTMRLYADKYHPAPRPLIPESVTRIFTMSNAELARELERA